MKSGFEKTIGITVCDVKTIFRYSNVQALAKYEDIVRWNLKEAGYDR